VIRYLDGGPYAVAHRGGAALAPENTLLAFDRSWTLGIRTLEADVRLTADGVCVVVHDAGLRRTHGVPARVDRLTLAEIRSLPGPLVPTLDEMVSAFPAARLMLDLKDQAALAPLLAVLRSHRALGRSCLAGAPDRVLQAARELAGPQLCTSLGWDAMSRLALAARLGLRAPGLLPAEFVHVPLRFGGRPVFRERLVEMAHALGLAVMVWTVDDVRTVRAVLAAGADGVISDRPDVLVSVMGPEPGPAVAGDAGPVPAPPEVSR
jgi:glycerophosphoryl diester phosphodiesterase